MLFRKAGLNKEAKENRWEKMESSLREEEEGRERESKDLILFPKFCGHPEGSGLWRHIKESFHEDCFM